MQITTFDRNLWGLISFDTVGYDKGNQMLFIFLFDDSQIELFEVKEKDVFSFIIQGDKESYLYDVLMKRYRFQHIRNKASFLL